MNRIRRSKYRSVGPSTFSQVSPGNNPAVVHVHGHLYFHLLAVNKYCELQKDDTET